MSPAPRIIALEGPSGAGKSTVARALGRAFGWEVLPEAFERLVPAPSLDFAGPADLLALERRLLFEERRRYRDARRAVGRGRTVLADTGFFGPITYTAGLVALGRAPGRVLDRLLASGRRIEGAGPLGTPDVIVVLEVPAPDLRRRLARDPVGHPAHLVPRHRAVERFERSLYRDRFRSLLSGRIAIVSGAGPPSTVARRVGAAVRRLAPEGPSQNDARSRLFDAVRAAVEERARGRARASAATVKKPARSARAPPR
jgi:hypothetical protein